MKTVAIVVTSDITLKTFLTRHIRALSEKYKVTVICNTSEEQEIGQLIKPATLINIRIRRNISPVADFFSLFSLIYIFYRHRFDAVHTVSPKAGLLGIVASWLTNIKIRIHTFQGEVWVTRKGLLRILLKSLDRIIGKLATNVLVVSNSEREFLITEGIIKINKSTVIGNGSISGVDLEKYVFNKTIRENIRKQWGANGDVIFLYLGRLKRDKGVLDLIEAFSILHRKYNNTKLAIIGPDEENLTPSIEELSLRLGNSILLHGYTEYAEKYYSASDVLCLPSYREGFGVVVIEAAAVGIPSIGSRIYGVSDAIIDGQTGLLHTSGDIADIADKMIKLAEDEDLRKTLAATAQQRVRNSFSQEYVVSNTIKYYDNLLKQV